MLICMTYMYMCIVNWKGKEIGKEVEEERERGRERDPEEREYLDVWVAWVSGAPLSAASLLLAMNIKLRPSKNS